MGKLSKHATFWQKRLQGCNVLLQGIAVGCPLSAVRGRYENDYRVMTPDGMRMNWIQWHIDHPTYKLVPYAEGLLSPQASWFDWRNANHDGAGNDVPIEWGDNIDVFQASFYDNVDEKRIPGAFERKTREVVMGIEDNFYAFTFCQYVYYGKPGVYNATDAIPTAYCNDASHWYE